MKPLTDLHIVVTRPAAQAQLWQQHLQALGASVHVLPVLEIVAIENNQQQQRVKRILLDLDHFQMGLFVSQNAVHHAARWIDDYWPQRPLDIEYFAVGSATAEAAVMQGFDVTAADQAMNSETLLQLPALQQVKGKKVVIFRGVGGRPAIESVLTERGASVTLCELYQRCVPPQASSQLNGLNLFKNSGADQQTVLTAHSGESLDNLLSIIDDDKRTRLLALPLLVPGERVAHLAQEAGFSEVIVSVNATDQTMTETLIVWYNTKTD